MKVWIMSLLLGYACMASAQAQWMKQVADTTRVCRLSIPGTHDSAARYGGKALETQSSDIEAQLQQGIRAFDIRLVARDGQLALYHGPAFQKVYWESYVLPAFIEFLQDNPSEMLIVSLKREGGESEDYKKLLAATLTDSRYTPYYIRDYRPDMRMGEGRGKILFLHRDLAMTPYPGAACKGWADDATCELSLIDAEGCTGKAWLQDEYQYKGKNGADEKLEACICYLKHRAEQPDGSNQWGINFVSATGLPTGTPIVFAKVLNPALADYCRQHNPKAMGIFFIDFVSCTAGRQLVDFMIRSNVDKYVK